MLTIKGIYDGKTVQLLEDIPSDKKGRVIVTFLEDEEIVSLKDKLTASQYSRLQESLRQADTGNTTPHENVMAELNKWLK